MSEYKYRDKVSGQWISEAVDEQRILEFVTRGTLTPYDFVLICENNEDDPKEKKMIREVWSRENAEKAKKNGLDMPEIAEEKWAMLRKIRLDLNRLWKAQLDDIMAIISSGLPRNREEMQRQSEPSLGNFRKEYESSDMEVHIKSVWGQSGSLDFIKDEIKYRQNATDPLRFDLESSSATKGQILSKKDFDEKCQKLKKNLKTRKAWVKRGVYVFYSGEEVTYVGKATKSFGDRFKQHFRDQKNLSTKDHLFKKDKRFLHDTTKLKLYTLKMSVGKDPIAEFESLMIFLHGIPDEDHLPRDNWNSGCSSTPLGVAINIVQNEIEELKSTAEGK